MKTLHPAIHGGILADRRKPAHVGSSTSTRASSRSTCVVVNLYPFRETVASGAELDDVIEKIDIGGPAMVRAAAKNFESVGVVVDPARYGAVLERARCGGRADPRDPRGARRGGVRPHRRLRRRRGGLVRRARQRRRGAARRSSASPTRRSATSATARTRISAARCTARRPAPARSAAPRCCRARTCRSTTGSTRTPPTSSPPRCPRARP